MYVSSTTTDCMFVTNTCLEHPEIVLHITPAVLPLACRHVSLLYCQLQGHMMSCDPPTTEEERENYVLSLSVIARHLLNMVCPLHSQHPQSCTHTNVDMEKLTCTMPSCVHVCFVQLYSEGVWFLTCLYKCLSSLQGDYEAVKALSRSSKKLLKSNGKSYKV